MLRVIFPCSMRTITVDHRGGGSCRHIWPNFYKAPPTNRS